VKRRDLLKIGGAVAAVFTRQPRASASGEVTAGAPATSPARDARAPRASASQARATQADADYIVVGSGAGGGTLAARLAESGSTVLVLEAGGDPRSASSPEVYDVPAFHPLATEDEGMRWDFFVRHYGDEAQQKRDPKYRATWNNQPVDGVYYPRAGTLGGCTAHNAMILVYPHNADWNELADRTGDRSWRAEQMRKYFERLEDCHHRPFERLLSRFGINRSGHGWSGWLRTERPNAAIVLKDRNLGAAIIKSIQRALSEIGPGVWGDHSRFDSQADPNDSRFGEEGGAGVFYTPLTTDNHARVGTRERLLDVQRRHPDRLRIELNALATRVVFDENNRAIGVEYLKGERLYRADPKPHDAAGDRRTAYAGREVVLCGGVFNTPQLLMLSGVGPGDTLQKHAIPVRVDLPGVGRNLQDRYEVAVVNRMDFKAWKGLEGATFTTHDAQFKRWADSRQDVYTSNGAVLSVVLPSSPSQPVPDLYCYGLIADFSGYFPGYSRLLPDNPNCLTWVVLKGHTNNTAGEVTLRSSDPRDPPFVNFRYFREGNDHDEEDLNAVAAGVRFVRRLAASLTDDGLKATEEVPGAAVQSDAEVKQFIRDNAWGHHASCTCPIGSRDTGGVLGSDFTVHGTRGLRVVDASVFPRAPGLFIVSAIYMIAEKAADVILNDAKRPGGGARA
jgi:choline dehydrogenase